MIIGGADHTEVYRVRFEVDTSESTEQLKQAESQMSTFGDTVKAIFASQIITAGMNAFKQGLIEIKDLYFDMVNVAGDFEVAQTRLETAITISGDSIENHRESLAALKDEMWDYAGVGEKTVTEVLAKLINYTGDYDKAVMALKPTLDLAASGMMNIDSAARNVGKTYGGFAGELGEVIPALKALTAEELKAGQGLQVITSMFGGQATSNTNTFRGSIDTLKESFVELADSLGGPTTGAGKAIGEFANQIRDFAKSGDAREMGDLLGDIAMNVVNAANAVVGGTSGGGLVDGIKSLLAEIKGYTGSDNFVADMHKIADAVIAVATALTAIAKATAVATEAAVSGAAATYDFATRAPSASLMTDEEVAATFGYVPTYAAGGYIPGISTGTDPYMIRVDGGEYVLNANLTSELGKDLLDEMSRRHPSSYSSEDGMASGGAVDDFIAMLQQKYGGIFSKKDRFLSKIGAGPTSGKYFGAAPSFDWMIEAIQNADYESIYNMVTQRLERPGMYLSAGLDESMFSEVQAWVKEQMGGASTDFRAIDERRNEAMWEAIMNPGAMIAAASQTRGAAAYGAARNDAQSWGSMRRRSDARVPEARVNENAYDYGDWAKNIDLSYLGAPGKPGAPMGSAAWDYSYGFDPMAGLGADRTISGNLALLGDTIMMNPDIAGMIADIVGGAGMEAGKYRSRAGTDALKRMRELYGSASSFLGAAYDYGRGANPYWYQTPSYHSGGMVPGDGEQMAALMGGEFVFNRQAVLGMGQIALDQIQTMLTGGGGAVRSAEGTPTEQNKTFGGGDRSINVVPGTVNSPASNQAGITLPALPTSVDVSSFMTGFSGAFKMAFGFDLSALNQRLRKIEDDTATEATA